MSAALKKAITDFLEQAPCNKSTQAFLLRVRDDPDNRIDGIWRALTPAQPGQDLAPTSALLLIRVLKTIWMYSGGAVTQALMTDCERASAEYVASSSKEIADWLAAKLADKSVSPEDKATLVSKTRSFFQKAATFQATTHNLVNFVRTKVSGNIPQLNIRSDHGGSRQRTAFMRMAADFFHKTTGKWHDDEVATLTDIAFPDEEATTIDMVRSARRGVRP
jgi:hypothetical protein